MALCERVHTLGGGGHHHLSCVDRSDHVRHPAKTLPFGSPRRFRSEKKCLPFPVGFSPYVVANFYFCYVDFTKKC